jgi:hypothetical protein
MHTDPALRFDRPPSALRYMLGAFLPGAGFDPAAGVPRIAAAWTNAAIPPHRLADFVQLTGLRDAESLSILVPQVWGFRLQMALLTHRMFPLKIWTALQVRNHLLQHRQLRRDEAFAFDTRVTAQRALDKGIEVDLHTTARVGADLAWEGLTTFYYRRRLNGTDARSPLAASPSVAQDELGRWRGATGSGWRFGRLTGDFNGLHWSSAYARRFGFRRAFYHPQRALGECLAHLNLPLDTAAQRLDAWLKGPVFYGSELALRGAARDGGFEFGLSAAGDERPAIVGRWSAARRGDRLIDEQGAPLR